MEDEKTELTRRHLKEYSAHCCVCVVYRFEVVYCLTHRDGIDQVSFLPGGVGFNVASALTALTRDPSKILFISAVGSDAAGDLLLSLQSRQR